MLKLALMASSLFTLDHFGTINLSTVAHLSDYGIAALIALLAMPWVVRQFDS